MNRHAFAAMAVGLATTLTTPICLAQSSSTEHEHLASQSSISSSDITPMKEIRASKLIGINVTSKDGENLGQVQDLIFNPRTGKIRFALVGKEFMAGLGQKLIPVPWKAVNVRSEREFALNVDKSKLKDVPNWSQSEMDQPDYVVRIYRFYELQPLTDTDDAQSDVGGSGSGSSESGHGQGSSSQQGSSSDTHSDRNSTPKE
jgi:sporulation protein YlmC with PRC-barrel domain